MLSMPSAVVATTAALRSPIHGTVDGILWIKILEYVHQQREGSGNEAEKDSSYRSGSLIATKALNDARNRLPADGVVHVEGAGANISPVVHAPHPFVLFGWDDSKSRRDRSDDGSR